MALYAGRPALQPFSQEEYLQLQALDLRIQPVVAEYIKAHPKENHACVNWRRILEITPEEDQLIRSFQERELADYWLAMGRFAADHYYTMSNARYRGPTASNSGGENFAGRSLMIPPDVVYTAMQCVNAVRMAVGVERVSISKHFLSVRLLRHYNDFDAEYIIVRQINEASTLKFPVGAAACGSETQFQSYITLLKNALD